MSDQTSILEAYDKSNRNAFGQLYSPSQKYGVTTTAPNGAEASIGCYVKLRAIEIAMDTMAIGKGASASIYRRCNPRCKLTDRFWNDGQVQHIEY